MQMEIHVEQNNLKKTLGFPQRRLHVPNMTVPNAPLISSLGRTEHACTFVPSVTGFKSPFLQATSHHLQPNPTPHRTYQQRRSLSHMLLHTAIRASRLQLEPRQHHAIAFPGPVTAFQPLPPWPSPRRNAATTATTHTRTGEKSPLALPCNLTIIIIIIIVALSSSWPSSSRVPAEPPEASDRATNITEAYLQYLAGKKSKEIY